MTQPGVEGLSGGGDFTEGKKTGGRVFVCARTYTPEGRRDARVTGGGGKERDTETVGNGLTRVRQDEEKGSKGEEEGLAMAPIL